MRRFSRALPAVLLSALAGCENVNPVNSPTSGTGTGGGDVVVSDKILVTVTPLNVDTNLTFSEQAASPTTGLSSLRFRVDLSAPAGQDIEFGYGLESETATVPTPRSNQTKASDVYLGFGNDREASLDIPAGATTMEFGVTVVDDKIYEPDNETFFVLIGLSENAQKIARMDPALFDEKRRRYHFKITLIDNDLQPSVGFANAGGTINAVEGEAVPMDLALYPSSSKSGSAIRVPINYSLAGALPGKDFVVTEYVTFSPEQDKAEHQFLTINDAVLESGIESVTISLGQPENNAALLVNEPSLTQVTVQITDDDVATGVNDTGIASCTDGVVQSVNCPAAGLPNQDGDSQTGFQFTRLDIAGNVTFDETSTRCVLDNTTRLVWEVKPGDDIQNIEYTYSWYNQQKNSNGGDNGYVGVVTADNSKCGPIADGCNTENYAKAINDTALCGRTKWRMPSVKELMSIMHVGPDNEPLNGRIYSVDTSYFDDNPTTNPWYWSASPLAGFVDKAWAVYFGADPPGVSTTIVYTEPRVKESELRVRLVAPDF